MKFPVCVYGTGSIGTLYAKFAAKLLEKRRRQFALEDPTRIGELEDLGRQLPSPDPG